MTDIDVRLSLTIPLRTVSEANRRECWQAKQRRAKRQRTAVRLSCRAGVSGRAAWTRGPLVVTMCRVAWRALDTDNLAGALKHVRDGIADALGRSDGPGDGIEWRTTQRRRSKGGPKYAVEISIGIVPREVDTGQNNP